MPEIVIGLLAAALSVVWRFAWPYRTIDVQFWEYVTYAGAAYLAVGLVRDVLIKLLSKSGGELRRAGEPTLCLESAVGPLMVAAGLAVLLAGVKHTFHAPMPYLGVALGALFIVSGLCKDVVLVFRKEKNHSSLIPW